jgi:putative endopeptidase
VALVLSAILGFAAIAQTGGNKGFNTANLDTTCKACDNFYQYANGGWLKNNPIPPAFSVWGTTSSLNDHNIDVLHQILEEAAKNTSAPAGSIEQKIGAMYGSCMNTDAVEAAGTKPLQPGLAEIEKLKTIKDMPAVLAAFYNNANGSMFNIGSTPDQKKSTEVIASLGQGGTSLPDRDYYLLDDEKSKTTRDAYIKYMAKMFELTGDEQAKAASTAQTVIGIETKLAQLQRDRVANRDPDKRYNKMSVQDLQKLTPDFNWGVFLKAVNAPKFDSLTVAQPEFFQGWDKLLTTVPVADWKSYLRWRLINGRANELSSTFETASFDFYGRTLSGTKEMLPRWRRCTVAVDSTLGEAVGQEYVKRAFTPEAKARMSALVKNLIAALREDIGTLDWMSADTKKQAIAKLNAFNTKIGYPDKWRDYSALKVSRASYFDNLTAASQFASRRNLNKIGKPVDRTEWGMTPPTVNAYNNSLFNEIVFPAGILQPPFFNPEADDAVNYGAIGAVIGHEMTHGFDDQGRKFDLNGNRTDWWTPEDAKNYQGRADCVEHQFSSFKVEDGLYQNGKSVLGESIADLGGLKIAYLAFKKSQEGKPQQPDIDGFTPDQRFFLGWAQVWGRNQTTEAARRQAKTDPHPLSRFRVNGPLSNMPEFAAAFSCAAGDPMVRPEKDRCQVW